MAARKPSLKFIGDIALVKIPDELDGSEDEIGRRILSSYPHIRSVVRVYSISGPMRVPRAKVIAGSADTVTVHAEYGCRFKLDVLKLMFSLGNSRERMLLAGKVKAGELVVDMFAGVGQFTIPIGLKASPKHIYSFEINPEAHRYLVENICLNKLEKKVTALNDDSRNSPSYGLEGRADRIIMGYINGTIEFLPTALRLAKPEGAIIHFHELAERGDGWRYLLDRCNRIAEDSGYTLQLLEYRQVKSYSPSMSHWALDLLTILRPRFQPTRNLAENPAP
jgi:tRNA wybutosine-synthesizing protein 2